MKKLLAAAFLLLFSIHTQAQSTVRCVIKTSLGDISVELYPDKAPITVSNFLKYVDAGLYDSSSFYRVCTPENEAERPVQIEVIQGGNVARDKAFEPVRLETTQQTGLSHENGTLSMARTAQLHSATSHFFVCIGAQPALDFGGKRNPDGQGFAAFGKVTAGMDIVKAIQQGENTNQRLMEPVTIITIERIN